MQLDEDDVIRADLIQQQMCQGEVPMHALERRHAITFKDYFAEGLEKLRPLEDDGLVRVEHDRIKVTARGRLLLRNIAMCFDRYLAPAPADSDSRPRFSRAI
jgi:oxygen-independent coproporphyrinogen-3 oxidase